MDAMVTKAKKKGRDHRQAQMDLAHVRLFCGGGIPLYMASREEWKWAWQLADPLLIIPNASKLEDVLVPGEQEVVKGRQCALLAMKNNLTISYDGGTSAGRESFWTICVSGDDRVVYFMEGREATSESHTAEWIRDLAMEVRSKHRFDPAASSFTRTY